MLLVVDVGNTQTVIGVYEDVHAPGASALWRIRTDKSDSADDLRSRILPLFQLDDLDPTTVGRAAIASVVPALTDAWNETIERIWETTPILCCAATAEEAGLFETSYPHPSEIGADRVADAIAVKAKYGAPAITVDFGTATNFEVIDEGGRFIGGIIAPGMTTGATALFSNASRLAGTELIAPPNVIGRSTDEALRSGIMFGEACRVDGLIRMIEAQLIDEGLANDHGSCRVVATGGLARRIAGLSECITDVDSELTLEGLRILAANREDKEHPC